jgi:hypothetical protein
MAKIRQREHAHISINRELYERLEKMRLMPHCNILLDRSTVYEETLSYGIHIQSIRKEVGEKEFERIWNLLQKLDLRKVDLERVI